MVDNLAFTIDGREYKDMSLLVQHSSAPLDTWIDELVNPTHYGLARAEVELFMTAIEGRNSWCSNGMSKINLGERCAVLRLATRWHCEGLRALAIDSLEKLLTPLERLGLARAYHIRPWFVQAYTALTLRADPPSIAEARQLDAEDVVHIFSARENVFRHRLPAREESVASHFVEVVSNGFMSDCANRASDAASPAIPSLSCYRDNEAIIFFGSSFARIAHRPDEPHRGEIAINETGDIAPFLVGKYDDGVALITAANVHTAAERLSRVPEFLSGGARKGTPYKRHGADLVLAALRRAVRQPDFVPIGAQFAGAILEFMRRQLPSYEHPLSHSLQSLDALWGHFTQSGVVPRQDNGKVMPSGLTPDAYRVCMKNGLAFIAVLTAQGFVREWKWATHAHTFGSLEHPSTVTLPPPSKQEPADSGSNISSPQISNLLPHPISGPLQSLSSAATALSSYHGRALRPTISRLPLKQPGVSAIVNDLISAGNIDAGFSWLTAGNVDEVCQRYLAYLRTQWKTLPKNHHIDLFCALLCRTCDDHEFHATGLRFLIAICEERPELVEQLSHPIDWVITSWRELLLCPDTTPSMDQGKIVRRWQSPGMAPPLYKERIGNVCRFILSALERPPICNAAWVCRVRTSFA